MQGCEANSCHKLGCLKLGFQFYFTKPESGYICGCCQQSYYKRQWILHITQKSAEILISILSTLSYSLVACISATLKTALHMEYHIFKCNLRRKINAPRMLGPHWVKSETTFIIWEIFKNKAFGREANCILSASSIVLSQLYFM